MFTQAQLTELVRSGGERFKRSLEVGPEAAQATYEEIEEARRTTCNRYMAWVALTDEYVFEAHGHDAHRDLTRPERVTELTYRSGLELADVLQIQALLASADNPLAEQMRHALAGAPNDALAVWQDSERLLKAAHDLRRDLISDRLGQIYRNFGEDALSDSMFYAARRGWWSSSMPEDFALEPEVRLRNVAFFLSVCAYFELRIDEESDRWVLHADVCGRCGRQCRDRYFSDDWPLEVIPGPSPMTFGRDAMTVYQTHAAVIHHQYAIDTVGAPWPVFDCRGVREDPSGCRIYVYKDPAQTPDVFYEQVDRVRPEAVATE
jgi:hypothetical protein